MRKITLSLMFIFNLVFSLEISFAQDAADDTEKLNKQKVLQQPKRKPLETERDDIQEKNKNSATIEASKINKKATCWFFIVQTCFLLLVFFGYPLFCCVKNRCANGEIKKPPLRGLALPQGSVRAMIAIGIIGSYLITLSMGSVAIPSEDLFDKIIASFGGLVGAVVGFYFGSRGQPEKEISQTPKSEAKIELGQNR